MIFEGGVVGVIVGMHGVGANWEVLKRTSIEHPIAVHVVGACGPPVPRRASTMASYSPLGSPVFPWSRFLRYSYRWRPGKTSDTTTALLQIHAFPSQSPHIPHQLLIRDMWTSSFWNLQSTISYKMLTHFPAEIRSSPDATKNQSECVLHSSINKSYKEEKYTPHTYTTGGPNWDVKEPLLSIRILVPCKSLKQTAKNGDNSTFQNCKLPLASFLLL